MNLGFSFEWHQCAALQTTLRGSWRPDFKVKHSWKNQTSLEVRVKCRETTKKRPCVHVEQLSRSQVMFDFSHR